MGCAELPPAADQVSAEQLKLGMLFPPQSEVLEVAIHTATRVAKLVFDSNLAQVARPDDIEGLVRSYLYTPTYG
jgi:malate dehydrogenase (oxaloacetate-decarboxylating)(NADP+)